MVGKSLMSYIETAWDRAADYINYVAIPRLQSDLLMATCVCAAVVFFLLAAYALAVAADAKSLYLLDFALFQTDEDIYKVNNEQLLNLALDKFHYPASSMNFMRKICKNAGLGPVTYIPRSLRDLDCTMKTAREEAETVIFGAIDTLLEKTGIDPQQISGVVTNCSLFCPTPSFSSMIVNRYNMRSDVRTFSLGGMGCSASIIGVDLVRAMMRDKQGLILLVSTENMTQNFYRGEERSMLMQNVLFRLGCSAVLFCNSPSYTVKNNNNNRHTRTLYAKYKLLHLIRTHHGANDASYRCVYQTIDDKGNVGVIINKDVPKSAGKALNSNMKAIFKKFMPVSEIVKFVTHNIIHSRLWPGASKAKKEPFVPNVSKMFSHLCFHTGGRGVLDEMERLLRLNESQMAASRATLYRYGNTSSSSIWYELAYHERQSCIKPNQKIWQIAFGSGFKCNSAVWQATPMYPITKPTVFDKDDPDFSWEKAKTVPHVLSEEETNKDYDKECNILNMADEEKEFQQFLAKFKNRLPVRTSDGPYDIKEMVATPAEGVVCQ